ncbi:hypothetical protein A33M_2149 [Rhodovulum sp. PH10]|uniref:PAS domain S-box protein n=1 Tax=Rhodovulum sp. PH10 TaxID=1187851 RepID=UPI00027C233F|nr:PAS domain S-box protein [Rhodovulum sp. PH10]EJW12329.1 hypothetical protein A33M_2149 [Rhodovulum sp. PH10]
MEHGWETVETAAELLADHAERAIDTSRIIAGRIAEQVTAGGFDRYRGDRWEDLQALGASSPMVGTIWVLDANGDVVATTTSKVPPASNVADRPYFRALKAGAADHLSGLMRGRVTGRWFFGYSQAIRVDGVFRGLVQVTMHIENFRRVYDTLELDLGPKSQIGVYKPDGTMVVRWPLPTAESGESEDAEVPRFLAGTLPHQDGRAEISAPNGREFLQVFRTTPRYGLLAVVTIPCADVLEPFYGRLASNGSLLLVALAVIGVFGIVAGRAASREMRETRSLVESEERFRAVFHNAAVGIAQLSPEGRFLVVNERLCAIVGYTAEELNGKTFMEITHPDDLDSDLVQVWRLRAGDVSAFRREKRYVRRDGSAVWVDLNVSRLVAGGRSYNITVVEDITARKAAELALRDSEQQYRALFENAAVGIAQVSADGLFLSVNDRFCDIVGYTAEELRTTSFQDITHPADIKEDLAQKRRVLSGVISNYRMEKRYLRKNGSRVWVDLSVGCVRPGNGVEGRFVTVVNDITERKQIEKALLRSEERLRLAGEAGNVGVWDWDIATGILTWTLPQWRLHGLEPRETLTYDDWRQTVHPEDRDQLDAAVMEAVTSGGALEAEYRVVLSDGSIRWLATRAKIFMNEAGQPLRLTGVDLDISVRKEAEEQQRQMSRELDHRVRNTLATVQSIVVATARAATDIKSFRESIVHRIGSLAKTHTLLTNPSGGIALTDLLHLELDTHEDPARKRIALEGPHVLLPSSMALALGLALHELAVNAAKYGSLSVPEGRLAVRWSLARPGPDGSRCLSVEWVERGGPSAADAGSPGFGSTLIDRIVTSQPDSHISREFGAEGLRVTIALSLPDAKPRLRLVS